MTCNRILTGTIAAAFFMSALGASACRKTDKDAKNTPPAAQIATQSEQRINQPVTVDGCLRSGEGGSTFVLTTAQTDTGEQPATYHLVGSANVNLADHVGERVSVTGQLQAQQHASTQTPPSSPANKPTGTSGTPAVSTETDLTVRTLDVSQVKSLGSRCDK